jgi:hypothetical protein
MRDDEPGPLVCATYTHARRHPWVLGAIGDWALPFQVTLTQVAVFVVSLLVVKQTWPLWGRTPPGEVGAVFAVGIPGELTWAARRVRVEGRSPARAALGWVQFWSTPPQGTAGGRPVRERRPVNLRGVRVYVARGGER